MRNNVLGFIKGVPEVNAGNALVEIKTPVNGEVDRPSLGYGTCWIGSAP